MRPFTALPSLALASAALLAAAGCGSSSSSATGGDGGMGADSTMPTDSSAPVGDDSGGNTDSSAPTGDGGGGKTDSGGQKSDGGAGKGDSGSPAGDAGVDSGGGEADSGGGEAAGTTFPPTSTIYQNISGAPLDPNSTATINAVTAAGGWGGSGDCQIDFSFTTLYADMSVPLQTFTQGPDWATPDCDTTPVPLPPGGNIEGSSNYSCDVTNDDCHLVVYRGHWLFEAYQATTSNGQSDGGLQAGCVVAWDLTHDYWQYGTNPYSRGDQCTSTDAAGMPIGPLLVKGSELAAGVVPHALRFILPNARMQKGYYLHPGTHAGGPSGAAPLPIYASRWRLKSSFDMTSLPNAAAKAVAVALQNYGMFLDDGGNIPLTFDSTAAAYIGSHDLGTIQVSDFEVVASPDPAVVLNYNCQRTPLTTTN
jgi:hypothetical protein